MSGRLADGSGDSCFARSAFVMLNATKKGFGDFLAIFRILKSDLILRAADE
mgnify:CR=1 FL=1